MRVKVERGEPPPSLWPIKRVTYSPTGKIVLAAFFNYGDRIMVTITEKDVEQASIGMTPEEFDEWANNVRTMILQKKAERVANV